MQVEIRSRQIETIQESITKMIRKYGKDVLDNKRARASNAVRKEVMKDLSSIRSLMNDIVIK
jgi:hypothetical protein